MRENALKSHQMRCRNIPFIFTTFYALQKKSFHYIEYGWFYSPFVLCFHLRIDRISAYFSLIPYMPNALLSDRKRIQHSHQTQLLLKTFFSMNTKTYRSAHNATQSHSINGAYAFKNVRNMRRVLGK